MTYNKKNTNTQQYENAKIQKCKNTIIKKKQTIIQENNQQ